nr:uncharacterized protein LOC109776064 [Aegilops tauschii subsp. strangulata]
MGWIWGARARPPRRIRPMLVHLTPHIFVPIRSPEQALATSLHSPPLSSATRARLLRVPTFSDRADSGSDSDHSGFVDWGVISCGLEEAMAIRIALHRSQEDSARPMDGSVSRDAVASAHRALRSSGVGSLRSRQPEHLSSSITGRVDYESHRERAARRGKERIRAAEARIAAEMAAEEADDAAAQASAEEEAIRARIVKKR